LRFLRGNDRSNLGAVSALYHAVDMANQHSIIFR
jgi:hypothetical protein